MKKLINRFLLWYKFDITDIVAVIYAFCVIGIMLGYDMNIIFTIGCIISLASCIPAKRVNLIIINVFILAMNIYYLAT